MPLMESPKTLIDEAADLISYLANNHDDTYGLGCMSCTIYDTAWVSMVAKETEGKLQWLFPESFDYLLEQQAEDGAWESYAAQVDGIMNSLAALLAIKKHQNQPELSERALPDDIETRIQKATSAISQQLRDWDVEATMHVGFEYLVPALLRMLEAENVHFNFRGRNILMYINEKKMSRFQPSFLYSETKITALHSLEAFIGLIDFDRVKHHKTFGSMMASPSSTAAYLICTPEWDTESEAYLRHVVGCSEGKHAGGVPSAFPSNFFETTWVVSTLLENGFYRHELGEANLEKLAGKLQDAFAAENGLLGFAPFVGHDADDTSKALLTLELLGKSTSAEALITEYEGPDHFRTYASERNSSLSANANVLLALLHQSDPGRYLHQIEKCARFICNEWSNADGTITDKWNLAEEYPVMLIVQALIRLLRVYDSSQLPGLSIELLQDQIPVVLFQALVRCLKSQKLNGSWKDSPEVTAYAVLTLANLSSLPFVDAITPIVHESLRLGRQFLETQRDQYQAEHLWIEKVTYGSKLLYKAYTLAALNVAAPIYHFNDNVKALTSIPWKKVYKFAKFYSMLPLYASTPEWLLQASLIEGYLFLPRLRKMRLTLFPRQNMADDKYFEYIPFTWTGASNRIGAFMNTTFLFEMMVISFLGYQVDEYMETVVGGKDFVHRLPEVVSVIDRIFSNLDYCKAINSSTGFARLEACERSHGSNNSSNAPSANEVRTKERSDSLTEETIPISSTFTNGSPQDDKLSLVADVLSNFVHFCWHHPVVQGASPFDRSRVKYELKVYLLAHVAQVDDNSRLSLQDVPSNRTLTFSSPTSSFYQWVRTTSADHTSCPWSFAFVSCLLSRGPNDQDCFKSAEEKYVAEDLCRHLASMCRQYNDYGSLQRDRDDKNLNSVNFPEFLQGVNDGKDRTLKDELFRIAAYERKGLNMAMGRLKELCDDRKATRLSDAIQMFIDVTDVYGQIYVLRDIDGPTE